MLEKHLRNILLKVVATLLLLTLPSSAFAWGPTGHRVVAEIAQRHLTPAAQAKVSKLLDGRTLADVANWPDELRSDPRFDKYRPIHFATVKDGLTSYRDAEKVILVCDNLNTHTPGAFYEAFPPDEARELVKRLEFRHTPKHGSWLNIAENELSAMTRQCVQGRRFATIEDLRVETSAWSESVNAKQRGVDWQFRVDDARIKLKSLYPKTQT